MMRTRVILAGLVLAVAAPTAQAQCLTETLDACRKAADLVNYITPQLSTALVGGNATLGQGGSLGGLGHFALDVRASVVNGSIPKLNNLGLRTTGAYASTFTSEDQMVPAASLDAAVGLWRGIPVGVSHIGGIDALITMTYLPSINSGSGSGSVDFNVSGSNEKFGYGLRVGLLEESLVAPGVAFSWVQRDLPTVSFGGTVDPSGTNPGGHIALNNYALKTTAWRLTAGKNLMFLGLSAGYGQDKYDASASVASTVNLTLPVARTVSGSTSANLSMTRSNMFVGASINLFVFKLEAEAGQVSGGTLTTLNNFGTPADKSRTYYTVGLRFGR